MVLGLGNPGKRYERTRHNVGFRVLDELAGRGGAGFRRSWRVQAQCSTVRIAGVEVLLVKPQTYMNLSGRAAVPLMRKKGVKPADLVVVLDDADLGVGQLRIRRGGSAGGHRGLLSVIELAGTDEIARVRVGVGRGADDLADHVLSAFGSEEAEGVSEAIARAADAIEAILEDGIDKAMNDFNG